MYPVPFSSAEANGQLTYDTGRGSQYRVTECGTNGKYNNEPSKTGVPKMPLWDLGGQACNRSEFAIRSLETLANTFEFARIADSVQLRLNYTGRVSMSQLAQ